eukprot:1922352-Pyramimonas_sp.AAC.1
MAVCFEAGLAADVCVPEARVGALDGFGWARDFPADAGMAAGAGDGGASALSKRSSSQKNSRADAGWLLEP